MVKDILKSPGLNIARFVTYVWQFWRRFGLFFVNYEHIKHKIHID